MKHAIVLGAGMGGLLAARALSDHFTKVTVLERDALDDEIVARKGVPQGKHAHGILAAGLLQMEAFFPALREELYAEGAERATFKNARWVIQGRPLVVNDTGEEGVACSRPQLEHVVRRRVRKLANVTLVTERDILGLRHANGRVDGVHVRTRSTGAEETLHADLVVDATGRGSKLPSYLEQFGYAAPREERVKVGVTYTTGIYPRKSGSDAVIIVGTSPPNPRCGVALALDAERYMVTVVGYFGERAETTHESMVDFARTMPATDIHDIMHEAEPLAEHVTTTFPHSQRRIYEELTRHPEGVIAFGDAISSFNPIFGQGMTVAALEAQAVQHCLGVGGISGLWRRFYRKTKPIVDVPWSIAVGNDLRYDAVEGKRTFGSSLLNGHLDRVLAAAAKDPVVGTAFVRVTNLLDPPTALFAPKILARTYFGRAERT